MLSSWQAWRLLRSLRDLLKGVDSMIGNFIIGICTGMNMIWVMEDIKSSKYNKWTVIASMAVVLGFVSVI